jgi:hypothetical protein
VSKQFEWNPQTGNYEANLDGSEWLISGDEMSEEQDAYCREKFGVSYADADDAQTVVSDAELSSPYVWIDRQIRHARD